MSKSERMVRKLRARERRRYTEEFGDEEIEGARMFDVEEKLVSDKFDKLFVKEMKGEDLNLKYIQEHGFDCPIVIKNTKGLGLKMPDVNFTVSDVRQCVGSRRILDVMDVTTQKDFEMTMKEWCQYYENPVRDRLLNVISLEFSHTKLDSMIESPTIVRQVDWVDWVWPRHLKLQQTVSTNSIGDMKYPKVQKYCLMSVKGCYTDFHIDFGGTSVWYHILKGQKVFWLIPPSERNIQLFEQWVLSGKQSDIFFGDTVEQCARIRLYDGYTFFIPTGWIHAVYTSEDSLVFGGNFLHSFAIEKQLRIAQVEDITKVPAKFRYPFYHEMLWYVLQRYVYCLTGKSHLTVDIDGNPLSESSSVSTSNLSLYSNSLIKSKNGQHAHLTSFELNGLKAIIMWLGRLTGNKRSVPELIQNPEALLNDAKLLVDDHGNDNHKLAVTGHPLLFWHYGRNKSNVNPIDNLSSHLNSSLSFPAISSSPFSSSLISNSSSSLSTSTSSSSLLSSSHTTTSSSTLPIPTTLSSSSNLSITAQLRQIKNTSFTSAFHLSKSTSTTSQSETSTRPESPPTRPLSSNQYSINLTQLTKPLDQIPQSFAQLIAATGVGNQNRFNSPTLVSSNNNNGNNNLLMSFNNSTNSTLPTATISSTSINVVNTQASELVVQKPNTDTYVVAIDSSDFSSGDMSKSGKVDLSGGKNNPLNDSARRRRTRCKKCEACLRADCGDCHFCRDMKKFGGPGRMKQSCIARQCLAPVLPHTACCIICGRDGWEKMMPTSIDSEAQSSLLECSKCWEIVHPSCLKEKNPSLNIEGVMSDELPNSWECPKCIASIKFMTNAIKFNASNKLTTTVTTSTSITATSSKPANLSVSIEKPFIQQNSSTLKTQAPPSQDVYDFHTGDVLPEATCKRARFDEAMERRHLFEENNNSVKNSETTDEESDSTITSNSNSASNNGSISGKDKLSIISSTPSLTNISQKTNDSHVRSCARFPLLQEAIKKQSQEKKASESEKKASSKSFSESSSTSKGSRANKKHHQSARDRLFKSLKGLKKNSEMVRYSSNYNGLSSLNKKLPFKTGSPSNGMSSSASNGPSNTPSPILSRSTVDSPASTSTPPPSGLKANSSDVTMKECTKESEDSKYKKADQYMFDDDTDNEIEEKENSMATSDDASSVIEQDYRQNDPPKIVVGTKSDGENLIKPKYVVRPAPLPEDLSDDDETEEGTDVDDTSEDESERSKVKKKFVKKLNRKVQGDLNIAREVILPVFRYLPLTDLMNCMYVCRKWNTWSMDPVLWKFLDLTRKKITYFALIGIVRRQPLHLNLSWTNISKRQLAWLMARLPQLQTLNLTGSSAASISALCSCNCPLLRKIDLSWVDSLNDNLIKDLLSYPSDSRPGLLETKTRLRLLTDISVAGSDISDVSIRLLCNHLPQLSRIDLSNCQKVTDMGVGFLGASKASKLVALNLSSCSNISDASLDALKRCTTLVHLDVRDCSQVSTIACQKFIATCSSKTRLMMKQTKLIVARNQRNPL